MADDRTLLREYVESGSEDAFHMLVEQHARMVYGTAFRVLGQATLAEEVSQAVFILLARKASRIRANSVVAGWLYRTTRLVALEALRSERRRKQHHEKLIQMNEATDVVWPRISPLLEDAMERLGSAERDAVVLRFFEGRSFADVAQTIGTTEPAAKMRISRALEKLRASLAREGVVMPAAGLITALVTHAAPGIRDGFVSLVSSVALTNNVTVQESVCAMIKGAMKAMAWNKIRNGALALALILLSGTGAGLIAWHHKAASPALKMRTLEPMAGEWEGIFEMRGDGIPARTENRAALSIETSQQGRLCRIEMRIMDPNGRTGLVWHFTHVVTERGDRIITMDDPRLVRPLGDGVVVESVHNPVGGAWSAAFVSTAPDQKGSMDCRWSRRGEELIIIRHDRVPGPQGITERTSELQLHRAGTDSARL